MHDPEIKLHENRRSTGHTWSRRRWLALGVACVAAPAWSSVPLRTEARRLFGSPVELVVPDRLPTASSRMLWRGLAAMDREWNAWKPGQVTTLNRAFLEERSAPVTPALVALIDASRHIERLSGGHFNAGIGGLIGEWGFHADRLRPGSAPSPTALADWLELAPSLQQLQVRDGRAFSRNPQLRLDFGGIGKGAALEWAMNQLETCPGALLNLGGNLAVCGDAGGRPWQVGIRDPRGEGILAVLPVRGREAVVTSGSYERVRLVDGEPVSHVFDPRTGRSAAGLASVTVVHRSAVLADAAATALLVAGERRWREVARRLSVHAVLVVAADGRRWATPCLAARLQPSPVA